MTVPTTPCLVLACGNTLRSDDGIGPWLAAWAEQHCANDLRVRVLSRQQWTPELAQDVAQARTVLFLDCSVDAAPGEILVRAVEPTRTEPSRATHHLDAPQLLNLTYELYGAIPLEAALLTVGAGSLALGDGFSPAVTHCLPQLCERFERTLRDLLLRAAQP